MMNFINNTIREIEKREEARKREVLRRQRISFSLKKVNQIKRDEKGFHRVRLSVNGTYQGYYLLPNLYE